MTFSSHRIAGYREACFEQNIERNDGWIKEIAPNFESVYQMAEKILQAKPDAIITDNDVMAMDVMKCLKDYHISVSNDILVVGMTICSTHLY